MFKMLRYLRPYYLQAIVLVVSVGLQAYGVLRLPTLMSQIVNDGVMANNGAGDMGFIIFTGARMLVWTLISALGALSSSYFSAKLGAAIGRDIRDEMFKKILSFSISEIDNFSTASLITRTTNDISTVQQTLVMMLSMMLRAPIMAIGAIFEAVQLAPDMTWIIALSVTVLLVLIITILSIVMPKFMLYQKLIDKVNLLTRENLTGLRVIRAFNNEDYEARKFDKTNTKIRKTDFFIGTVMGLESPLMMFIFNGTSLLCIWIGVTLLEADGTYLGKMMAFMQYATQVIMSFLFLAVLFVMVPRASVSAKRIEEVLGTKPKIVWKKQGGGDRVSAPSVEFKNVSFKYAGADDEVLSNVSFVAKAGETTAFIGSTGSGKSTLINLIPRFYDVTEGAVLVDGIDIREYSAKGLMKKIGYVPQKGFLFSGTVKSNILFGVDVEDEKRMKEAAEIAQASEFISKLPDKFDAKIVEAGTNVSGGQRQRLSIARVVAKNPEIYIFDDAFSALDMKTDKKLREALKPVTKNSVTLIVAQRVSTIRDAEQIVVLDKGKVVGKGKHKDLIRDCKAYQEICESQLSEEEYRKELEDARA
ncbi:ABC transporter ATP-binding protein [Candidatus Saccharibacteria bacterium]|nr:ABC transporter ATP-binding protein [Candidatus Saccharibacteria bacterium]